MSASKKQFMAERQAEEETPRYSRETIKYHMDFAANLRDQATKVKGIYTKSRLIRIAEDLEDIQPLSRDDLKFLNDY